MVPGHPGRGPHCLRNPKPADAWLEIPSAVMIGGPTPRFVTHPVPSVIGALPMPIGIGTPIGFHASRDPAATVVADVFPAAIRTEWLIKVALVTDDDLVDCRLGVNRLWSGWRIDRSRLRIGDRGRPTINVRRAGSEADKRGS